MSERRPLPYARHEPRQPAARARQPAARREPPFRPQSWGRALVTMCGVAALLWIIQALNAADDYGFNRFGLKPREADGLWGIVTMPFLHAGYRHLLSNTVPLIAIGWALLLSGLRIWALVTATVVLVGGLLTWLAAPGHSVIVGASGLIFGWLGYLLARAYFSRRLKWIIGAIALLVFFSSMLAGMLPSFTSDASWPAHLCGFATGVAIGAALHPRGGATRFPRRAVVS